MSFRAQAACWKSKQWTENGKEMRGIAFTGDTLLRWPDGAPEQATPENLDAWEQEYRVFLTAEKAKPSRMAILLDALETKGVIDATTRREIEDAKNGSFDSIERSG
jgi:hypothetical protein